MTEQRCGCGATLVRGALACSLCHAPVPVQVPAVAEATSGANGFLVSTPPATQRNDQRVFSRVEAGPVSFGWTGRLVLTALCAIPIFFVWFMSGGGLANAVLCLPVFLLPLWFLRESWRRGRVR